MTDKLKKYESIGCCGIDCGLCPRFYTNADSVCPFKEKHPSCGFLTCCVIKNGLEVCSDCNDYPCKRFDAEKSGFDSFVTHKKVYSNLDNIKSSGIVQFIEQQKIRIDILTEFLTKYDNGRSKSFFCVCCALLPLDNLIESQSAIKEFDNSADAKTKNKKLRGLLTETADTLKINLKLNN